MNVGALLLLVFMLVLVGVVPAWPHRRNWGYAPTGGLSAAMIIVIVLLLLGRF